ncbi:hypothetical protein BYT27DRAFT_7240145 [Phlegmacium glaucopus]|nr:hypothetical protein BYT27DRAFT_7240145 [Phlegmacium glaucopus]
MPEQITSYNAKICPWAHRHPITPPFASQKLAESAVLPEFVADIAPEAELHYSIVIARRRVCGWETDAAVTTFLARGEAVLKNDIGRYENRGKGRRLGQGGEGSQIW